MAGNRARTSRTGPNRLMPSTLSRKAWSASTNGCVRSQPAALTSTSIFPPVSFSAPAAQSSTLLPSVSSSSTNSTGAPCAIPIVSLAPASLTSHRRTRAPSRASISTVARPMPDAPPVIITVLYSSSIVSSLAPRAGQEIGDPPLRLLRRQQASRPLGLRREAVALGVARQAHAHLAGRQRQRMQAGDAARDLPRLVFE